MPTALQRQLDPESLSRSFPTLQERFRKRGVDLKGEIGRKLDESEGALLDIGCGYGVAIEQATRMFRKELGKEVGGFGVDKEPLPDKIPSKVLEGDSQPIVEFKKADARKLPLADNSVAAGYSFATLQWMPDVLRALEDAWRVLEPGGVFLWGINQHPDISVRPKLVTILDETPGARETFECTSGPFDAGVVKCTKRLDVGFDGFPFTEFFSFAHGIWGRNRHYRRSVYVRNSPQSWFASRLFNISTS